MSVAASIRSSPSRSGITGAAPAEPSEHLAAPHAAFMFQGFPLIVAALSLRSFDIPLEVKALLVAAGGVAGSFALGWALVAHASGPDHVRLANSGP